MRPPGRTSSTSFSLLIFERFRAQRAALSDVFAFAPFSQVNVLVDGVPETHASAQFVSGNYYARLGVPAVLGPNDHAGRRPALGAAGRGHSYRYWERRFGGDPGVLGKRCPINRVAATIVGVTPQASRRDAGGRDRRHLRAARAPPALPARPRRKGRALVLVDARHGSTRARGDAAQARASLEPIFQETAREGWLAGRSLRASRRADAGRPDAGRRSGRAGRERCAAAIRPVAAHPDGPGRAGAGRRVRQRRQSAARARRRPPARNRAAARARRQPRPHRPAAARRVAAAGLRRRGARTALAWWSRDLLLALRPFGNARSCSICRSMRRVLGFTIGVDRRHGARSSAWRRRCAPRAST